MITPQTNVIIIGGGPAGLTAAYQLSKRQIPAIVLEEDYHEETNENSADWGELISDISSTQPRVPQKMTPEFSE